VPLRSSQAFRLLVSTERSSSPGDLETAQMDELRQPPVGDAWLVDPPDEAE
jgi:hypothetical protein